MQVVPEISLDAPYRFLLRGFGRGKEAHARHECEHRPHAEPRGHLQLPAPQVHDPLRPSPVGRNCRLIQLSQELGVGVAAISTVALVHKCVAIQCWRQVGLDGRSLL